MTTQTLDKKTVLEQANEALQKATKNVKQDHRLGFHIAAPANWINDPNGLVYFKGEYHVFYQHHPYDEHWGPMHWGHAKSKDLVHWEHLPIALAPDEEYDRDGCFSGSAIVDGDTLYLVYTGHVWVDRPKDIAIQTQCIASSKDGITFTKFEGNPVIKEVPSDSTGHLRDPKVWKQNDDFHMVLGNRTKDDIGRAIHYSSKDLKNWHYEGVIAKNESDLGYMWECPDFIELDGKHALLFSPQGMKADGDKYQNLYQTGYLLGDYNESTGKLTYGDFVELDHGHDYYAVQTLHDDKGRRIGIGWMDMWESNMPTKEAGWCGALTLPRELSLSKEGKIIMKPVAELELLRDEELVIPLTEINNECIQTNIHEDLVEIKAVFSLKDVTAEEFGIKVRCSEDGKEETIIGYDVASSKLFLDREHSGKGVAGIRKTKMDVQGDSLIVHVYCDRSSVEVFANDGDVNMTSRIYPNPESLQVQFYAKNGKVAVESVQAWKLKDIWKENK
ncbi:glycoside hydrolase family 32 protein [Bacillus massiliigorillae]|uniref:glycoside hydrolase family 32 protein n=1 Tax=Bacillus massiliigorillae TaxID=1243664 RepID=UPI0003A7218E|nr:glycoside hydrolase family 32 protein [Bacillus massiliigorillae]